LIPRSLSIFGSPETQQRNSENDERPGSAIYDPEGRNGSTNHRPSVSSIDSFGSSSTQRSFPLINKPKSQVPFSPHSNLDQKSQESDFTTLVDDQNHASGSRSSPVDMLAKEDQILVERLVASLGKCVLGLQEASRGSYEGRVWRRRLDFARRTLEGEENVI